MLRNLTAVGEMSPN